MLNLCALKYLPSLFDGFSLLIILFIQRTLLKTRVGSSKGTERHRRACYLIKDRPHQTRNYHCLKIFGDKSCGLTENVDVPRTALWSTDLTNLTAAATNGSANVDFTGAKESDPRLVHSLCICYD